MGDRSVTGFADNESSPIIYLYSHWGASSQVSDLQEALIAANPRWNGSDYATRIAVSHLTYEPVPSDSGYGLSVGRYCSPDLPYILVVLWEERRVDVRADSGTKETVRSFSFEEFLALTDQFIES